VEQVDPLDALVAAAARGEREAQRTLLVALGPALLRTVRGVLGAHHGDVEDVLQEAMVALISALPSFRGECQTVHFASRVAVQTAMNARRRAGYRARYTPSAAPEELSELARDEHSPAEDMAAAGRRAALNGLLDELPPAQSEALVLHTVLGYSVEETARATEAPVNTVRSRLRAALAALRVRVQSDRALLDSLDRKP
jgi:RNA polymerase sigma factor (sigma-70 family)